MNRVGGGTSYLWEYRIVAIAADCKSAVVRHRWFESIYSHKGPVAQLVEQRIEDPRVGSSLLSRSTKNDPPLEREETRDIIA